MKLEHQHVALTSCFLSVESVSIIPNLKKKNQQLKRVNVFNLVPTPESKMILQTPPAAHRTLSRSLSPKKTLGPVLCLHLVPRTSAPSLQSL